LHDHDDIVTCDACGSAIAEAKELCVKRVKQNYVGFLAFAIPDHYEEPEYYGVLRALGYENRDGVIGDE
jgi:hypothetical protein